MQTGAAFDAIVALFDLSYYTVSVAAACTIAGAILTWALCPRPTAPLEEKAECLSHTEAPKTVIAILAPILTPDGRNRVNV